MYSMKFLSYAWSKFTFKNIKVGVFRLAATYIPMAKAKLEEEKKKVVDGAIDKYA